MARTTDADIAVESLEDRTNAPHSFGPEGPILRCSEVYSIETCWPGLFP